MRQPPKPYQVHEPRHAEPKSVPWNDQLGSCLRGFLFPMFAEAVKADVFGAKVSKAGADAYRFGVTVWHEDTGWDHHTNVKKVIG